MASPASRRLRCSRLQKLSTDAGCMTSLLGFRVAGQLSLPRVILPPVLPDEVLGPEGFLPVAGLDHENHLILDPAQRIRAPKLTGGPDRHVDVRVSPAEHDQFAKS